MNRAYNIVDPNPECKKSTLLSLDHYVPIGFRARNLLNRETSSTIDLTEMISKIRSTVGGRASQNHERYANCSTS